MSVGNCSSRNSTQNGASASSNRPLLRKRCITDIQYIDFAFEWTIKNFTFQYDAEELDLKSMDFSFGSDDELKWCLEIYPVKKCGSPSHLVVVLVLVHCSQRKAPTKFEISILNDRNEKTHKRCYPEVDAEKVFEERYNYSCILDNYIEFDVLLNKANGLLPEDNLTILCEGTTRLYNIYMSPPFQLPQIDISKCTLYEKYSSLFESQDFSDFTLLVDGKELPVHKVILASQSSVFAAMFKHEVEENKQNRVSIEDINYDILREMLLYIYTGKLQKLEEMACELLVAADKYNVSGLKEMCEVSLCSTLTTENAVNLLSLADTYSAKQLKAQVIHFISRHAKGVMLTSSWKYMNLYPQSVIIELFEALALK